MSSMFANVQPAVKKETKKVAIGTFGLKHIQLNTFSRS